MSCAPEQLQYNIVSNRVEIEQARNVDSFILPAHALMHDKRREQAYYAWVHGRTCRAERGLMQGKMTRQA